MRYREIVEAGLPESFSDDTRTPDAASLDADTYLEIDGYEDEQAALEATYVIDDPAVLRAVRSYTRASDINAALRSGEPLTGTLAAQDEALMSLRGLGKRLPERHHVYSGAGAADLDAIEQTGTYVTDAFISASLNIAVAVKNSNYHREHDHGDHDTLLHFVLPKGYRGCFYLGEYSASPEELEMLLFPDEPFRMVRKRMLTLDDGVARAVITLAPDTQQRS